MTIQHAWRARRPAALQLAAGLGLLALAGCGGSPAASSGGGTASSGGGAASPAATQAAASKPVNVCSLLSAKQVSALVGFTYTKATPSSGMCSYATTTAPIPLYIIVSSGSGSAAWTEALGTLKEDGGEPPRTFTGVGDRAAGDGTEFDVQSGGWIIDVHGGDPSGTGSSFPKSTAVANALISALKSA